MKAKMLKSLKVLSRRMDLSGHWSLKSEARSFSEKFVCPQSCESRLKVNGNEKRGGSGRTQ